MGIFSLPKLATLTIALAHLIFPIEGFNLKEKNNVVAYWGQNSYSNSHQATQVGMEKPLASYCMDSTYDVFVLGFLVKFNAESPKTHPVLNLGIHCNQKFPDSTHPLCPEVASGIKFCQSKGKKVLLSLGGQTGDYTIKNDKAAENFAEKVWNLYLGGSAEHRPFGDAVLDGIDLDIEKGPPESYAVFSNKLREIFTDKEKNKDEKEFFVAAAPQCVFPDKSLKNTLEHGWLDMVFVQFYNNECGLGKEGFNFATWDGWARFASKNKDVKVFLGAPAAPSAASSGYLKFEDLEGIIGESREKYPSFGGVMMWDVSQADQNVCQSSKKIFSVAISHALKGEHDVNQPGAKNLEKNDEKEKQNDRLPKKDRDGKGEDRGSMPDPEQMESAQLPDPSSDFNDQETKVEEKDNDSKPKSSLKEYDGISEKDSKDHGKEISKGQSNDASKDQAKDESKSKEKEGSNDKTKGDSKDKTKENSEDKVKGNLEDHSNDEPTGQGDIRKKDKDNSESKKEKEGAKDGHEESEVKELGKEDKNNTTKEDKNNTTKEDKNNTTKEDKNNTTKEDKNNTTKENKNNTTKEDKNNTTKEDKNNTTKEDKNNTTKEDKNNTTKEDKNNTTKEDGNGDGIQSRLPMKNRGMLKAINLSNYTKSKEHLDSQPTPISGDNNLASVAKEGLEKKASIEEKSKIENKTNLTSSKNSTSDKSNLNQNALSILNSTQSKPEELRAPSQTSLDTINQTVASSQANPTPINESNKGNITGLVNQNNSTAPSSTFNQRPLDSLASNMTSSRNSTLDSEHGKEKAPASLNQPMNQTLGKTSSEANSSSITSTTLPKHFDMVLDKNSSKPGLNETQSNASMASNLTNLNNTSHQKLPLESETKIGDPNSKHISNITDSPQSTNLTNISQSPVAQSTKQPNEPPKKLNPPNLNNSSEPPKQLNSTANANPETIKPVNFTIAPADSKPLSSTANINPETKNPVNLTITPANPKPVETKGNTNTSAPSITDSSKKELSQPNAQSLNQDSKSNITSESSKALNPIGSNLNSSNNTVPAQSNSKS